MKLCLSQLAIVGLAGLHGTSAHYGFPFLVVNGVISERFEYVRGIKSFYPLEVYSTLDAMCGKGATPSLMKVKTAKVAAGDTIGFAVSDILNGNDKEYMETAPFRAGSTIWHPGPATAWLSKAPTDDLDSYQGDGDWFKFDVIGSSDGMAWDVGDYRSKIYPERTPFMNFTIPTSTPPGKYLLRAEHLAMHIAQSLNSAQMYPACAQIEITGSGTGVPGPVTRFPGAFDAKDPGIWLPVALQHPPEPMDELKNWQGAGPAVWRG